MNQIKIFIRANQNGCLIGDFKMELNKEQIDQISQVKRLKPFMITWCMFDKDTNEFFVYSSSDKRQINKAAKQGHKVFVCE